MFEVKLLALVFIGAGSLLYPFAKGSRIASSTTILNLKMALLVPSKHSSVEFAKDVLNVMKIKTTIKNFNFLIIFGIFNPAEKIGLKPYKEDVGQTLGSYGIGPGCYFVLPILGPTTARDSLGLLADTYLDPFAHVTIREKELLSSSGNNLDYYSVKATSAIDFRANNDKNLESLEKNSLDFYTSVKSIYLQDRENKIRNSTESEDEWGNLDN